MEDKIYCDKCVYLRLDYHLNKCSHPLHTKVKHTALTPIYKYKSIKKWNKNNDCFLFERMTSSPPKGR